MDIPENAERDIEDIKLIYSKDGKQKEFTMDNYPKGDDTWTFVDTKGHIIKKGYQPPIHDFSIIDANEDDITGDILSNPSYTFLLIAYKLDKANDANIDKINDTYDFSKKEGYDFYALTSSLPDEIQNWIENTGAEYPFCTMDEIILKTIIRSNPGLLLIKNGTIINMWPNTRLPDTVKLVKLIDETNQGKIPEIHHFRTVFLLSLLLFIPLIGIFLLDRLNNKKYKKI
jgi:hypothetical protein